MPALLPLLLAIPLAGLLAMLLAWNRPRASAWVAFLTSLAALGVSLALGVSSGSTMAPGEVVHRAGGWPGPFGIALVPGRAGILLALLTGFLFTCATAYRLARLAETGGDSESENPAYPLCFPILLLALMGLFTTGDLFNFYVFFELVAVGSYMLVALGRHEPIEAAWKYSAQSALGSVSLLVGIALVYGVAGTLDMADLARKLSSPPLHAAPFFLLAFFLKAAVFPFHFWQPDAHAAATTEGSAILAGLLIKVGLFGLLRLGPLVFGPSLGTLFLLMGGATIAFGAAAAWRQTDAKRLLGFSSVSQLGFILVAIGLGSLEAVAAGLLLLCAHSLAKALLFLATGALSDSAGTTELQSLRGLGQDRVAVSAAYLVGMLSLAGLPLTAGFIGKVDLLVVAVGLAAWPAVAMVAAGSLMTLAYGVRAFQVLFWAPPRAPGEPASIAPATALVLGVMVVLVVAIGMFPGPLWHLCEGGARDLLALRVPEARP
ncbi:MAG: hypothetical protein FJZ01_09875 [Candidatus Sericytochromatia bacterium]|nr:hypothetical protein [Candidatus Tanganyikabacteria bacterium]